MKNHHLLYTTLLMCCILIGCTPNTPPPEHDNISTALKADFNFKTGSYWIYRDSISGEIDSFAETNCSDSTITTGGGHDYAAIITEYRDVTISQYTISPAPATNFQTLKYHYLGNNINLEYTDDSLYLYYYPLFTYAQVNAFTVYVYLQPGSDTATINNIVTSYPLNGQTFANVGIISHHGYHGYNDLFYISPGIGIIKMSLNHHPADTVNRVWEIQRWNIVQ